MNILITKSGHACLADFGLASISDSDLVSWTSMRSSTTHGGTVRWQAPEFFNPEDEACAVTSQTDIYSYAGVCYEVRLALFQFLIGDYQLSTADNDRKGPILRISEGGHCDHEAHVQSKTVKTF